MRLSTLTPSLIAASTTVAQSTQGATTHIFEVDNVFPLNDTYLASDIFPIAFGVQNVSAFRALNGNVSIAWNIFPASWPQDSSYPTFDRGEIYLNLSSSNDDSRVYVGNSNTSLWTSEWEEKWGNAFNLYWFLLWRRPLAMCDKFFNGYEIGRRQNISFTIDGFGTQRKAQENGKKPDLTTLDYECPALGFSYEVDQTLKAGPPCQPGYLGKITEETLGSPCDLDMGSAARSSIMSAATLAASESVKASSTTTTSSTTSSNMARATQMPVLMAGAACVIGCLASI